MQWKPILPLVAAVRPGNTAAALSYLLINRARPASAQLFLCIFSPSPLFPHGESSFFSVCLDRDGLVMEMAESSEMFIARAGLTWRRAQSTQQHLSIQPSGEKSKHGGIFHHGRRALALLGPHSLQEAETGVGGGW